MKHVLAIVLALACSPAYSGVVVLNLHQAVSISDISPDTNYASFDKFRWVGTNFAGATHQAMFGFDLAATGIQSETIESIEFAAYIPLRHGDGGEVFSSIGFDNAWEASSATYSSHANLFGDIQDVETLNATNLGQYSFWSVNVDDFVSALSQEYLTVYLYTLDVGPDGTNFHDVAGAGYLSGVFTPYLSMATGDNAVAVSESDPIALLLLGIYMVWVHLLWNDVGRSIYSSDISTPFLERSRRVLDTADKRSSREVLLRGAAGHTTRFQCSAPAARQASPLHHT